MEAGTDDEDESIDDTDEEDGCGVMLPLSELLTDDKGGDVLLLGTLLELAELLAELLAGADDDDGADDDAEDEAGADDDTLTTMAVQTTIGSSHPRSS